MWVYISKDRGVYTVGFYDPQGNWHEDVEFVTKDDAAHRVNFLNGGTPSQR